MAAPANTRFITRWLHHTVSPPVARGRTMVPRLSPLATPDSQGPHARPNQPPSPNSRSHYPLCQGPVNSKMMKGGDQQASRVRPAFLSYQRRLSRRMIGARRVASTIASSRWNRDANPVRARRPDGVRRAPHGQPIPHVHRGETPRLGYRGVVFSPRHDAAGRGDRGLRRGRGCAGDPAERTCP